MQPTENNAPAAPRSRSATLAALAVVVVAALLATLHFWRELAEERETARQREATFFQAAEAERAALRMDLAEAQRQLRALSEREAELEREHAQLRARTDQGRAAIALAEARHDLQLAEEMLAVARDPERAAVALRAADGALATLDEGAGSGARGEIRRALAELESKPVADAGALALTLGELGAKIADLPLRTRLPDAAAVAAAEDADDAGAWAHFMRRVGAAFRGLITVRRAPGGAEPLLPPEQEWFLRRNLELKLESARLAALARDDAAFHRIVDESRGWLERHFDPAAPGVAAALRALDGMRGARLAPAAPDLSRARALLDRRAER